MRIVNLWIRTSSPAPSVTPSLNYPTLPARPRPPEESATTRRRPARAEGFKSASPKTSSSWVTPATQTIGENDGYSGFGALFSDIIGGSDNFENYDAFGAIARGRVISPRYRFTITKEWAIPFIFTKYTVTEILFNCAVEDLYDFNYEDADLPSHAAAAQIGYSDGSIGSGRNDHGLIYRHKIIINKAYSRPFDHLIIPARPGP